MVIFCGKNQSYCHLSWNDIFILSVSLAEASGNKVFVRFMAAFYTKLLYR